MTYTDDYNLRTTSVKFNDIADAIDGLVTRQYVASTTGTASAYTASPTPAWQEYTASSFIVITPHVANAAGATLNVSGLGAKDLKIGGVAIGAGVIQSGIPTIAAYNGVYFEVLLQNLTIPIGQLNPFAGITAPTGWLLCDGTAVSRTTYAALYGVIGDTYGSGDGSTTFNLPDLRRRAPIGTGSSDTLGDSDGVAYASRSATQSHTVPAHYHGMGTGAALTAAGQSFTGNSSTTATGTTGSGHGHGYSLTADGVGDHTHTVFITLRNTSSTTGGTRVRGVDATGSEFINSTAATLSSAGAHGHSISGSVGGSDGTHTHNITVSLNHTHSSSSVTGTIGLVTGGVDGNAEMTSGAGQYLYVNYIIKI